jgi:acetolactate synthase-1/2/3 large subunit
MAEELTGAQILCRALLDAGTDTIFGYPGGAIMPFYHALPEYPALRHVLVRHEQAAAHAADGYARASGRVGVCVATSGPGATNLVSGIATAQADSVPLLAITGQVSRAVMGTDAFQETDVLGLAMPITKHCRLVRRVEELAEAVRECLEVARDGRPGAVWLDVPKDVQNQKTGYASRGLRPVRRSAAAADAAIRAAADLIAAADRPIILAGHGVILADAYGELLHFAEKTGIPVITTLLGMSAVPDGHPLFLGMPGMHGEVHVNRAIQQADLLIAVGMRFDDRVTGHNAGFAPRARVIHLELDPAEIHKVVRADVALIGDAKTLLPPLTAAVAPRGCDGWRAEIDGWRRVRHEQYRHGMAPEAILAEIAAASGDRATIVSDVGQHQMWVAKLYRYVRRNSHITSGGLGTMGFAVPAAMGVKLARPGDVVWAISGDGGFQMNLQELATMRQERIGVKLAVFNNGYLGMVRQWQQFFHGRRYSQTPIWSPDFVKLADAYGIPGFKVETAAEIRRAVEAALATDGPALIEFCIEQEANVFPMIPPGATLSEPIEAPPAGAMVPA